MRLGGMAGNFRSPEKPAAIPRAAAPPRYAPLAGTHWLKVRAMTGRRDALGALVAVSAGGKTQRRRVLAGSSYMSSNEPLAHFGLGQSARVDEILVLWPGGAQERFPGVEADQVISLRQGAGEAP